MGPLSLIHQRTDARQATGAGPPICGDRVRVTVAWGLGTFRDSIPETAEYSGNRLRNFRRMFRRAKAANAGRREHAAWEDGTLDSIDRTSVRVMIATCWAWGWPFTPHLQHAHALPSILPRQSPIDECIPNSQPRQQSRSHSTPARLLDCNSLPIQQYQTTMPPKTHCDRHNRRNRHRLRRAPPRNPT